MQVAASTPPFSKPGLYGKIPAQGDFVRVQAGDPVARALAGWLEEGSEASKRRGVKSGPRPVRFLFHPALASRALVGVMGGSGDKVGREFPLAIFASVEASGLPDAFPAVPEVFRPFLDGATAVLEEAPRLAAADLPGRLASIPQPTSGSLGDGVKAAGRQASEGSSEAFLSRLFGDLTAGQQLYAMHCLRAACRPARGQEPGQARAVLDCPVKDGADRWAWLEIGRRLLQWRGVPSFFWRDGESPGLLLSIGSPPPSLLGVLCDPAQVDGKIWPLETRQAGAIETARKSLGPSLVEALERPTRSIAELIGAVTSER